MKTVFSSLQWTMFILANTIVAPLSIGFAFHMSSPEIADLLQRTVFIIGITSLLQTLFGHKLPLLEGPAGLWWGVFLTYASLGGDPSVTLRSLELGLIISGILFLLVSMFNLVNVIKQLFTPAVIGTYLVLLVAQLSGPFTNGMLGIGYLSDGVNGLIALCAALVLVLSLVLAKSKRPFLVNYSVLISLLAGWGLFHLAGITLPQATQTTIIQFPRLFAWGMPTFDLGVVLISIFTAFLLLTNLITSIDVVAKITGGDKKVNYTRSGFVMGMNQILTGLFSTVGGVPISATAGFILTTKIKDRLPFIIGSILVLLISFFPMIMSFFASLPVPVGYATIFISIANLIGIGLHEIKTAFETNKQAPFMISFSLMIGFGIMFVPSEALRQFPGALTSILSNGLIVGVLVCIVLDQFLKEQPRDRQVKRGM